MVDGEIQHPSRYAASAPDRPAVVQAETGEVLTYRELEDRSTRIADLLVSLGCDVGANVALLLENRREYLELAWAALRTGLLVTPINWHLSAEETRYIAEDCDAAVLVASTGLVHLAADLDVRRLSVGGAPPPGFDDLDTLLAEVGPGGGGAACEGQWMFYSSGTTGRPKGIRPPAVGGALGTPSGFTLLVQGLFGGGEDTVYLSPSPLYHAAPSGWTNAVHRLGGTVVLMDRFDPVEFLRAIERHRVTHVQVVPTHLVRLMKLPAEVRDAFDLSSLRVLVHAAAPCPPELKRAVLDWLGPIVHEYFSGSEGVGFCAIGPEEWLAHHGSVGRSLLGAVHIVGADGAEVPTGEEGIVRFESPRRFEYHGDPAKTAEAFDERGWGTLGDIGRVDEDGYLYLTDRVSNLIISGGVNVYPREVEDALVGHPDVADVAVVGVADPDLGEAVRAVVQPTVGVAPSPEVAAALIDHCRDTIARFKAPRSVVFVDELPRLPTGKLVRRLLPSWVFDPEVPA